MAAGDRAEQRERRGHGLGDQVDDDLHDHAPDRELGVVERALDRQIETDGAVAVLEQRDREQDRQLGGGRAVDALAERQLVEHELVRRRQPALVDLVVDLERQRALGDAVSRVLARIGRERRQVDAGGLGREIERELARERIQRPAHLDRRDVLDAGGDFDVSGLRGRKRRHAARDIRQMRRVVRLDVEVRELHLAVAHLDVADRHGSLLRCRRRVGAGVGPTAWRHAGVDGGVDARDRRRRACGPVEQPLQVERRVGVDDEARKELVEPDRAERNLARRLGHVDAREGERLPAHELLRRRPVERAEVADRHVAGESGARVPAGSAPAVTRPLALTAPLVTMTFVRASK